MRTNNQGLNNILMISLIISFVLHFSLLQTDIDMMSIDEKIMLPVKEINIQIPIEFIPATQTVTTRQYSVSEIEAVQKLVTEADDSKTALNSQMKKVGTYSLNRARTALHHYLLAIREVIEKNKFTSEPSNYSNVVGNVIIGFSISASGSFSNMRIVESSGDHTLDKSALAAIKFVSGKIKRPKITGIQMIKTSAVIKYQYGL
jgi:TonB family protein